MSDYEARLALAREAYRATQPTGAEVRLAAARVESQLALGSGLGRLLKLLAGGGVVIGVAAAGLSQLEQAPELHVAPLYEPEFGAADADSAGQADFAAPGRSVAAAQFPAVTRSSWLLPISVSRPSGGELSVAAGPLAAAPAAGEAGAGPRSAPRAQPVAAAEAAPTGGWPEVARALAAGEPQRADALLETLAQSSDAETRAKALLGQAQLRYSKGELAEAKRLAAAAAALPGVSSAIKLKAVRLAARASR